MIAVARGRLIQSRPSSILAGTSSLSTAATTSQRACRIKRSTYRDRIVQYKGKLRSSFVVFRSTVLLDYVSSNPEDLTQALLRERMRTPPRDDSAGYIYRLQLEGTSVYASLHTSHPCLLDLANPDLVSFKVGRTNSMNRRMTEHLRNWPAGSSSDTIRDPTEQPKRSSPSLEFSMAARFPSHRCWRASSTMSLPTELWTWALLELSCPANAWA